LLKDSRTQLWTILLAQIDMIQNKKIPKREMFSFLFQISILNLGSSYKISDLNENQKVILDDLTDFGLIYKGKKNFYPTRMAITLSSSSFGSSDSFNINRGFLILPTTYKIYAYTSSNLDLQILGLFCKIEYRLPDFSVGTISRRTIRQALLNGITADQIIQYLEQNIHPEQAKNIPVLPETVIDQIKLWEKERSRITTYGGFLIEKF